MYRIAVAFLITALALGCHKVAQPAESTTKGNATDRSANGTTGTGEPVSQATGSAAAAQQLGTVAPSAASNGVAVTGTEDVHAAKTETTSTLSGPNGTTTIAIATPTDTTATVKQKKP
ncbi:MAG TPA: hypothetical protein VJ901_18270 [Thermoanaerobaculia bacterium]|nr:hypothetical protein [Thermoanaerobaculia bacterium]